jgi:hypothetical protein
MFNVSTWRYRSKNCGNNQACSPLPKPPQIKRRKQQRSARTGDKRNVKHPQRLYNYKE